MRDCGVRHVPDCRCDTGLYAKIRHPNYTGELMFWLGNFLAGLPAMVFSGVWPMIPALLGGSFINFLMNNQAKGQDEKQAAGTRLSTRFWFFIRSIDQLLKKKATFD